MASNYFALLDIGTSKLKVAVVESSMTRLKNISSVELPDFIKNNEFQKEIAPDQLRALCLKKIRILSEIDGICLGLLITGQMGGWVITDRLNNPLTNLISWQDTRATKPFFDGSRIIDKAVDLFGSSWLQSNGNEFRPGLPALGLLAYLNSDEYVKEDIRFHSIISWLASQICIDFQFLMHDTDAAASGFFDIHNHAWVNSAVTIFDSSVELPTVINEIGLVGKSLLLDCPVYCAVGDQQSSLFGIGLSEAQTAINIGTGGQVARISENVSSTKVQIRPYFQNRYILTKTHLPAGRAIASYLSLLRGNTPTTEDYEWMDYQALNAEPMTGLNVTDFSKGIAELSNDQIENNAPGIASGVISAICDAYLLALENLEHNKEAELVFAGGVGTKMNSISKIIGDRTGCKVRFSDTEETTLQGLGNLSKLIGN